MSAGRSGPDAAWPYVSETLMAVAAVSAVLAFCRLANHLPTVYRLSISHIVMAM